MTGIDFNTVPLTIDYTDRDFVALVASLRSLVSNRFPQITDFNTSSQVEMFIELVAAAFDRLSYMQDFHANEAFIVTARRLRNIIKHAQGIAYQPRTNVAATGVIQATITGSAVTGDVPIPAGTIITTSDTTPVPFQLTENIIIAGGQTQGGGDIKNSSSWEEEFESNLAQNQRFTLENTPVLIDDSFTVIVSDQEWERVPDFLDSLSTSQHYRLEYNEIDAATVIFGDGVQGAIPVGDIVVQYQTGGGVLGNQAENTITVNNDDFESNLGEPVRIAFTNPAPTAGGAEKETLEEIRARAPRALKALTRTVAREDFTINLEVHVPGVQRAVAFFWDQDPLLEENHAYVYVVDEDGASPSNELKDLVRDFLTNVTTGKPVVATMDITVANTDFTDCQPKGEIYYDPVEIEDLAAFKLSVRAAIEAFFDYKNKIGRNPLAYQINWGKKVYWSQVLRPIQAVVGVDHIQNFRFNDQAVNTDLEVPLRSIPRLILDDFDSEDGIEFIPIS